jgi:endonuclease YncB( thermonuclease family)
MTSAGCRGIIWMVIIGLVGWVALATAHQDPCHRRHSCPSDHGTYTCGDLGYCSQCPDNAYCLAGKPRAAAQPVPQAPQPSESPRATALVKRAIDGDTLELTSGETVRLIGVDTPETKDPRKPVQYFGKEATAFTQRLVEGKRVRLEYDQQRLDKYGRTLAYVYLEDSTFVNAEIIKQGYGFAYTRFPFKYLEQFRQLEQDAREAKRGLWKEQP